jgi:putative Mg2+ transporter-C (MgtC) family protein
MTFPSWGETLAKLGLAFGLAALIGWERESPERPAGLRTHILVCLGSCLAMILSKSFAGERFDPTRLAAQVITGVGFLGAGTVIRSGHIIRGLTTAASLWAIAVVGIAVGGGWYAGAAVFTAGQYIALAVVRRVEVRFGAKPGVLTTLIFEMSCTHCDLESARNLIEGFGCRLQGFELLPADDHGLETITLRVASPHGIQPELLQNALGDLPGVSGIESHEVPRETWAKE